VIGACMIIVNFDEYNLNRKKILSDLPKSVFIYPTDTIYGVGCNALDYKLVDRVRKIKKTDKPLSIIVPTKQWIYDNCVVTQEAEEWVRKLPGPYTLVLKLKNPKAIAKNVYNNDDMSVGIRMPNHWFLAVSYSTNMPIVTTSANLSGEDFMTNIEDLNPSIRNNVDYVFYDGDKKGMPSTIINLVSKEIKINKREKNTSKTNYNSKNNSKNNLQFPKKELDSLKK
jgi:L-threonylcarbamoyladenylate synthase